MDYARGIQDVASTGNPGDEKVRKRVRILYGRLWQYLLENDISLDDEEWQEEWEETRR